MLRRYVENYLHGRHSVQRTLFINYALPVALILLLQKTFLSPLVRDSDLPRFTALFVLLSVYGLLTIAAIFSLNRYSRAEAGSSIAMGDVTFAIAAVIVVSIYLVFSLLDFTTGRLGSSLVPAPVSTLERNSDPEIVFSPAKPHQAYLTGSVSHGATRRFKAFAEQQAMSGNSISQLILNSDGGNIFEARGLAKLVRDLQLDTHVNSSCLSACTLIFVNGKHRTSTSSAQFGFHAYHLDSPYPKLRADSLEEQLKDNQLFRDNGVVETFISQISQTDHSQIWIPSLENLLEARFLHQLRENP